MQHAKPLIKMAVAHPSRFRAAETFVRNHIKYLKDDAEVQELSGGWLPMYAEGRRIVPLWAQVWNKVQTFVLQKNFITNGICVKYWVRYFEQAGIQVLLCEFGPTGVAMLPVCKALNIPLVVHFHGLDIHGHRFVAQYKNEYSELFRSAAAAVVVSKLQEKIVAQMGCPAIKIHHIACGADLSFAQLPRPRFAEPPIFVGIGRLVAKKAPLTTIRAFAQILPQVPDARLVLIGEGPLMPACMELIKELKCERSVVLRGVQPHAVVVQTLGQAYCFVQHSITAPDGDSEGTPVAILEAGLAGLPVVATRHAGINDVVIHGETGFLVAENDVADMSERLLQLATDKALCRRMSLAATQHISENNAMPLAIKKLRDVLVSNINKQ